MSQHLTRRQLIGGAVAAGGLASWAVRAAALDEPATLFREVMLVDGTGAPGRLANVLVTGDRIARILPASGKALESKARVVAGEGRVLAPGFIDMHSHGDPLHDSY